VRRLIILRGPDTAVAQQIGNSMADGVHAGLLKGQLEIEVRTLFDSAGKVILKAGQFRSEQQPQLFPDIEPPPGLFDAPQRDQADESKLGEMPPAQLIELAGEALRAREWRRKLALALGCDEAWPRIADLAKESIHAREEAARLIGGSNERCLELLYTAGLAQHETIVNALRCLVKYRRLISERVGCVESWPEILTALRAMQDAKAKMCLVLDMPAAGFPELADKANRDKAEASQLLDASKKRCEQILNRLGLDAHASLPEALRVIDLLWGGKPMTERREIATSGQAPAPPPAGDGGQPQPLAP
jgi:hypothetical protein